MNKIQFFTILSLKTIANSIKEGYDGTQKTFGSQFCKKKLKILIMYITKITWTPMPVPNVQADANAAHNREEWDAYREIFDFTAKPPAADSAEKPLSAKDSLQETSGN